MHFDNIFLQELKKGDKKSFEKLFLNTYESLCEYSITITCSKETSEGAVQDVFTTIWEKRDTLKADLNIRAYLFRSVKNRSLDIVQHENIRTKYQNEVLRMYSEASDSAKDLSSTSKLIQRVHQEIESLPEKSKEVYLLHRRDGLTYAEIGQVLGITVKAVEARMTKALKILRERLAEENDLNLLPLIVIFAF